MIHSVVDKEQPSFLVFTWWGEVSMEEPKEPAIFHAYSTVSMPGEGAPIRYGHLPALCGTNVRTPLMEHPLDVDAMAGLALCSRCETAMAQKQAALQEAPANG